MFFTVFFTSPSLLRKARTERAKEYDPIHATSAKTLGALLRLFFNVLPSSSWRQRLYVVPEIGQSALHQIRSWKKSA